MTGTGHGKVDGGGDYAPGAKVNLIATPLPGSKFDGWSPSPCADSFSMPAEKLTCKAWFKGLTITIAKPGILPEGKCPEEIEAILANDILGSAMDDEQKCQRIVDELPKLIKFTKDKITFYQNMNSDIGKANQRIENYKFFWNNTCGKF